MYIINSVYSISHKRCPGLFNMEIEIKNQDIIELPSQSFFCVWNIYSLLFIKCLL